MNPGWEEQPFLPAPFDKSDGAEPRGGVGRGIDRGGTEGRGGNAHALASAGAEILVAGTAIYGASDPSGGDRRLRAAAKDGLDEDSRRARARRVGAVAGMLLFPARGMFEHEEADKLTQELLSTSKESSFGRGRRSSSARIRPGGKYLTFVFETYPNDPRGRDALLLVADSYFKQGGTGYTEARFRYRDLPESLPGRPRRGYARYQFALTYDRNRASRSRSDSHARSLDQYRALIREYPTSSFATAAKERVRVLRTSSPSTTRGRYFYMRKGLRRPRLPVPEVEQRYPEYGAGTSSSTIRRAPWSGSAREEATAISPGHRGVSGERVGEEGPASGARSLPRGRKRLGSGAPRVTAAGLRRF